MYKRQGEILQLWIADLVILDPVHIAGRIIGILQLLQALVRAGCPRPQPLQAKIIAAIAVVGGQDAGGAPKPCLLYTSDAADERSRVDLGGPRIIKKKKHHHPPPPTPLSSMTRAQTILIYIVKDVQT